MTLKITALECHISDQVRKKLLNDRGVEILSGKRKDRYKFKTPPLRNVALTGPYMHNGFFYQLKDLMKFHMSPQNTSSHFCKETLRTILMNLKKLSIETGKEIPKDLALLTL